MLAYIFDGDLPLIIVIMEENVQRPRPLLRTFLLQNNIHEKGRDQRLFAA